MHYLLNIYINYTENLFHFVPRNEIFNGSRASGNEIMTRFNTGELY